MIATTRTLRKILNVLSTQDEPIGITNLTILATGTQHFKKKFYDGLCFLISVGIVEKLTLTRKGAVYRLKYRLRGF